MPSGASFVMNHPPHETERFGPLEFITGGSGSRSMPVWKIAHHATGEAHAACKQCGGHDTEAEALDHWRNHLLQNELTVQPLDPYAVQCAICGEFTNQIVQIGNHPVVVDRIPACTAHATAEAIAPIFTMPKSVVTVYASKDAVQKF